jgi:4-oxalocrotonate tautomerase
MPVITIEAGKLSKEQKSELAAQLTKSASSIMHAPEQSFVVLVKENEMDNIAVGGVLVSEKHK